LRNLPAAGKNNINPSHEKNSLNFLSQKFGSFKAKTTSNGAMLNKECLYAPNFGKFNSLNCRHMNINWKITWLKVLYCEFSRQSSH
jgi:hypothetical protein